MNEERPERPLNGNKADIREVYSLIDQVRTEMHNGFSQVQSQISAARGEIQTLGVRVTWHEGLEGHPQLTARVDRITLQIAKATGALSIVAVLVGLFVKLI